MSTIWGPGTLILASWATIAAWGGRLFHQRQKRLRAVFAHDLSLATERFRQRQGLEADAAAFWEREFRRYFGLMAAPPGWAAGRPLGAPDSQVDDYWHELVLCTALYADYCQAAAGRFIHHHVGAGSAEAYARTWLAYEACYGAPDPHAWPAPSPMAIAWVQRTRGDQGGGMESSTGWDSGSGPAHGSCGGGHGHGSGHGGAAHGGDGHGGCGGHGACGSGSCGGH